MRFFLSFLKSLIFLNRDTTCNEELEIANELQVIAINYFLFIPTWKLWQCFFFWPQNWLIINNTNNTVHIDLWFITYLIMDIFLISAIVFSMGFSFICLLYIGKRDREESGTVYITANIPTASEFIKKKCSSLTTCLFPVNACHMLLFKLCFTHIGDHTKVISWLFFLRSIDPLIY